MHLCIRQSIINSSLLKEFSRKEDDGDSGWKHNYGLSFCLKEATWKDIVDKESQVGSSVTGNL